MKGNSEYLTPPDRDEGIHPLEEEIGALLDDEQTPERNQKVIDLVSQIVRQWGESEGKSESRYESLHDKVSSLQAQADELAMLKKLLFGSTSCERGWEGNSENYTVDVTFYFGSRNGNDFLEYDQYGHPCIELCKPKFLHPTYSGRFSGRARGVR